MAIYVRKHDKSWQKMNMADFAVLAKGNCHPCDYTIFPKKMFDLPPLKI
jgi:hypothetical protein